MKRRSLLLIVLIVLLPVGLLTWFGVRMARDEQMLTQQRFRSVMEQRLQDVNRLVTAQFETTERRLQQITAIDDYDIAEIREVVRNEPQVTQLFVLTPEGDLLYPDPGDVLNGTEVSFLQQTSRMITDRDLQNAVALAEAATGKGDFAPAAAGPIGPPMPVSTGRRAIVEPPSDDQTAQLEALVQSTPTIPIDAGSHIADIETSNVPQPISAADAFGTDRFREGSAGAGVRDGSVAMNNSGDALTQQRSIPAPSQSTAQRPAYDRAEQIPLAAPAADDPLMKRKMSVAAVHDGAPSFLPSSGWFVWYWDRGLNLVYWQRRPSGHIVGAALERARWIADLIAVLPETDGGASTASSVATAFRVVNSAADIVYEWGQEPDDEAVPFCEMPLASPLSSWRIQSFVAGDDVSGRSGRSAAFGLAAALGGFTLTLTALAWLLYRDYSRDMQVATQQVSFVNQVSHELKTPLTNIRLYAELLERDLEQVSAEQSEKPRRRLEIITAEAQRLSRLIGNVLTFARQQRKTLQLQTVEVSVNGLVRRIADRFAPSLQDHGVVVTLETETDRGLWLDQDSVEQILGNLISNVEKYAPGGKSLTIRCSTSATEATLDVIDAGPGIPASQRSEVFRPFARISNDLRASAGTGIGLSIARDLARLHGGDLVLKESNHGCRFQVRLKSMPP